MGKSENAPELGLADEWRRWVADALVQGADPTSLCTELRAEGVPEDVARREVDVLARALPSLAVQHRRMEMVLKLLAEQAPDYIARRPLCGVDEFYDRYFSAFRPVLFANGCERMAARQWTFENLRERFGDITIEIGDQHPKSMRFADALEAMSRPDASPELYIVSKNKSLKGPLAGMTADLAPLPDFLHPEYAAPTANLWLGPARTLSPLHHDTTHVYFCQFHGRKRYRIIAPWHAEVLRSNLRGRGDSDFDLDHPGDVRVLSLVVSPGESLFIPAGFWHEVTSLEPSISVSFRAYRWDARYDWYTPASLVENAAGEVLP